MTTGQFEDEDGLIESQANDLEDADVLRKDNSQDAWDGSANVETFGGPLATARHFVTLHRQKLIIGAIATLGVVLLILVMVASRGSHDNPTPEISGKKATLVVGPIVMPAGKRHETVQQLNRRDIGLPGNIMLKQTRFRIRTAEGETVPLEHIYNHHTFCMDESYRVFAPAGAENAKSPITFTDSDANDGFFLADEETILCTTDWIDLYGRVSTTNQTAFAEFEIIYEDVPDDKVEAIKADQMQFDIWGNNVEDDAEFPISPGPVGGATCISSDTVYNLDSIQVHSIRGHIHIGAINETLVDKATGQLLASAYPVYDEYDFLVQVNTKLEVPKLVLQRGSTYTTTACYKNRAEGYTGVMALWAGFYKNLDRPGMSVFAGSNDDPHDD